MKRSAALLLISFVFVYTLISFIAYQANFPLISSVSRAYELKYYDYSGVTHAHTVESTGSGAISELIEAAQLSKTYFLIVTDLNTSLTNNGMEGYRDGVMVIKGGEFSYSTGHLLVYSMADPGSLKGPGQNQIIFSDLLQQPPQEIKKGFLVAAHPFLPHGGWPNVADPGLVGMEILNLDSIWSAQMESNKLSVLWSLMILPFNQDLAFLRMFKDNEKELGAWDKLLQKRPFIGFAGNDTRANIIPYPGESLKIPSYQQSFKLLKNHVLLESELTGNYISDKSKIMEALGTGSFYMSLDVIGDPTGFYFLAEQNRKKYLLGSSLRLSQGAIKFLVDLGQEIAIPYEIILYRNGEVLKTSNLRTLEHLVDKPGAYRVVVRVIPTLPVPDGKQWFPWIYSNAISIN